MYTFHGECESLTVVHCFVSNTVQFMEFDEDNSGDIGKINSEITGVYFH